MSGIAKMLLSEGAVVTGSDIVDSEKVKQLRSLGARVSIGHRRENIPDDAEYVVKTAAIKPDNIELREAVRRSLKVFKYAEMLGVLMRERKGIAVSGTHGKTTTTAMISRILVDAGLDPTFVIGGDLRSLGGSSGVGRGEFFVAEACEYDRSFHNLYPHVGVITSIEEEHLDYYRSIEEITEAFTEFARHIPREGLLVINNEDANARQVADKVDCHVESYGIATRADWTATEPVWDGRRSWFKVYRDGKSFGTFQLRHAGRHVVLDALAAIAACWRAGVPKESMERSLASFEGVSRRFEFIGEHADVTIVDDYAHHPTEIRVTLKAARERFPGRRLWCVFQPHQHSRTRFFLKDFARSFDNADMIVVPDIYFVSGREEDDPPVSAKDLVGEISNCGGDAVYLGDFDTIEDYLVRNLARGDVLITMGAGNVNEVAKRVFRRLNGQPYRGQVLQEIGQ